MTAAIHQPNFLPWLGYFHKIASVETFIFFDAVALSNGKSWTARSQILLNGKPHWLSIPIKTKGRSGQKICEVELIDFHQNWERILSTIRQAYLKTPHFESVHPVLQSFLNQDFERLSDFNCQFIQTFSTELGLKNTSFQRASTKPELLESSSLKTDYIVRTCRAFEVQHYLSGKGKSFDFLELEKFKGAAISVDFQQFTQPIYTQNKTTDFVSGSSIIDILMYWGWEKTGIWLLGKR